ncbi:hypothetical protein POF45_29715 [Pseudomonas sp. 681]|uniref:Uncharacterized protein n=1 Tax=Pseudomonas fungipugnans TaxID=3024217 RepID=A0ABT6QP88_9PSED|nr:hypothetical protein [Pseudomonas sp. 681]MDI2589820.1 hypothetical protein [Pseudomonas sp. 681]MDI2592718.1 hypothetical protein [Pseudomonas sp. 681]MDI2592725.1 hypothetical protein [Pseudomonas sp. 681]MDI2595572.1 hypothetical protein [Pseudomonas sp. 681]
MLDRNEILDLILMLKVNDKIDSLVSSDRHNEVAKLLGYPKYSDLRSTLLSFPESNFREFSIFLMRKICLLRMPVSDIAYYEFRKSTRTEFTYYSMWSEDLDGEAVRVPRPLNGPKTVVRLRSRNEEVFVLESMKELMLWTSYWNSNALVNKDVATRLID